MKRTYFRIVSLIGALVVAVGIGAGGGAAVYSQVAPQRTQTVVHEASASATPIAANSTSDGSVAQVAASSLESVVEISTNDGQGPASSTTTRGTSSRTITSSTARPPCV